MAINLDKIFEAKYILATSIQKFCFLQNDAKLLIFRVLITGFYQVSWVISNHEDIAISASNSFLQRQGERCIYHRRSMAGYDRLRSHFCIRCHPPQAIPFKGQVLNQIAAYMLKATRDICPNWLEVVPAPHVSIGKKCIPFRVEMVVRGTLTGHAWRTYSSGKKELCGVSLPVGLKENDFFPGAHHNTFDKAEMGHDEDISREEIIAKTIVDKKDYEILEKYTYALFERGKELAAKQGLILADTKYEFGKIGDEIYLMDEIHTPDSSRYFYAEGFEKDSNRAKNKNNSVRNS